MLFPNEPRGAKMRRREEEKGSNGSAERQGRHSPVVKTAF
jgi:hypothetical protein